MTKEEKLIVTAYTGILMVDFVDIHKYAEDKLGRPVWSHEFGTEEFISEFKDSVRKDFMELCEQ